MASLWALMPALTILVEVGLDIAVKCIRNGDATDIVLMAVIHDRLQAYIVQREMKCQIIPLPK